MLLVIATWAVYAAPAYLLWPLVFRWKYGFSAWKAPLLPRSAYEATDVFLAVVLVGYSAALAAWWASAGAAPHDAPSSDWNTRGWWTVGGVAAWAVGGALRISALRALGPHWRIGQDESDQRHQFIARGIYRWTRHPINLGLIVVASGQVLLVIGAGGPVAAPAGLLAGAVLYALVQNANENRYWARRGRAPTPGVPSPHATRDG
ncbi:MAG: hypothetical protein JNJ48_07000 [Phycisphaerae bacterium]|nr:hypothetical protein [Phycisphaerae bacterium]